MDFSSDEIIKNAIIIINKNETNFRNFINYNYYLFTLFLSILKIFYYCSFHIDNFIMKYDDKIITYKINKLIILDNGINLNGIFLYYENIIQFGYDENKVYLNIISKIEEPKKILITFESDYAKNITNTIKINMYYHIKYHKINKEVLEMINS